VALSIELLGCQGPTGGDREVKAIQGWERGGKARLGKAALQDVPLPERRGGLRLGEGVGSNKGARGPPAADAGLTQSAGTSES
jgi:hypothetical protein